MNLNLTKKTTTIETSAFGNRSRQGAAWHFQLYSGYSRGENHTKICPFLIRHQTKGTLRFSLPKRKVAAHMGRNTW